MQHKRIIHRNSRDGLMIINSDHLKFFTIKNIFDFESF